MSEQIRLGWVSMHPGWWQRRSDAGPGHDGAPTWRATGDVMLEEGEWLTAGPLGESCGTCGTYATAEEAMAGVDRERPCLLRETRPTPAPMSASEARRIVQRGRRTARMLGAAYAGHAHPRKRAAAGLRTGAIWYDAEADAWQGPLVWGAQDSGTTPGLWGFTEAQAFAYLLPRWKHIGLTPAGQRKIGRNERALRARGWTSW